jgi:TolA-binding protein
MRRALVAAGLLFSGALANADTPPKRRASASATYEQARLQGTTSPRDVTISSEIESLIQQKERLVGERRHAAIALIEKFLVENKGSPEEAETLFQLAQLRWEESKAQFLVEMATYTASIERCSQEKCRERPDQPALHLESSQEVYKRLIDEYPKFHKIDAVRYLYGFSLRDQGKLDEALREFKRILDEHPKSRFRPDAWMALAEAAFYQDGDYKTALADYNEVLKFPDSPLYDLALFKTAWCLWKAGDVDGAAKRFKEVLDLGGRAYHVGKEGQKRLKELQNEALDYLVQIFTEDERKGPNDAYQFLSSIGGLQYARRVLDRLGETFQTQSRFDRAIETERFLINLDKTDVEAPIHQRRIVESYRAMDDGQAAIRELKLLTEEYDDGSAWAKKNADHPDEIRDAHESTAKILRDVAKELHAAAQANEKAQKGHADIPRYERAAEAYSYYIDHFGDDKEAVEISYLLGDIYSFKLKKYELAGDAYLAVGRSKPVGKLHKDALMHAINAYETVRQNVMKKTPTLRTTLPSDTKMGDALVLYADLFPESKEITDILYKNGELFYDYGDYDEAITRFGLIVEKYPSHPTAAAAGDKILTALNKGKNYERIEQWARRLLKVPAYKSKEDQDRLTTLVQDAAFKSGEQKAEKEPLKAAATFERVAKEFPQSPKAPTALANAATTLIAGGKPEQAVIDYGKICDAYPSATEAPMAAWSAGKLYEQSALWDQAARYYEMLSGRYPGDPHAADALFNAGLLREHLGETSAAIMRYADYSHRFPKRDDVGEVAFRVGVVLEAAGKKDQAAKSFIDYASRFKGGERAIEALARAGACLQESGADRKSAEPLEKAIRLYRASPSRGAARFAARARYLEGELAFKDYERISFAVDPKKLGAVLEKKSKKLDEAKGIYLDVVSYGDPEWATAALFRIGEAYETFAKAMRSAPVPNELKEDEKQVYREELEKQVIIIEEKAIDAYKNGYAKALQLGVYNEFTQKLRQALGRLNDQEFPPERETRPGPAPAEVLSSPPLIERVKR